MNSKIHDIPPQSLESVNVDELLFFFTHKSDSIAINRLRSGGIRTIGQLMASSEVALAEVPYIGATTLHRVCKYRQWLRENSNFVLEEIKKQTHPIILPAKFDINNENIFAILRRALAEVHYVLDSRIDNPRFANSARKLAALRFTAAILKERYINLRQFSEIAELCQRTPWHVVKTHVDFVKDFLCGHQAMGNIILAPDIVQLVNTTFAGRLMTHCPELVGADPVIDEGILNALGLSMLPISGRLIILVPCGSKCKFAQKAKAVMRAMRNTVVPIERDTLTDHILNSREFKNAHSDLDITLINNMLISELLTERTDNDSLVKIADDLLFSDEQRMGRIIYDHGDWLGRTELEDIFRLKYKRPARSINFSNLKKYNINSCGDLWRHGSGLESLSKYIDKYVELHKVFYLHALQAELRAKGYPLMNRIRSYITTRCLVDNLDPAHFCLKGFTHLYPQFNWRRPGRSGLTNWILNRINDLFASSREPRLSIEHLVSRVEQEAERQNMSAYIRSRVRTCLRDYTGPEYPFLSDGFYIWVNSAVHPFTDFNTIGRRGYDKLETLRQVRHMAMLIVGENKGIIPLVELIRAINERLTSNHARSTVLRALTNDHMDPLPLKMITRQGSVYVTTKEN